MEVENEIWRNISENPNYQVSNMGMVKSLNYNRTGKEKVLKLCKNSDGYLSVNLCKDGKAKNIKVHRLVAEAFIENPLNLPQVNHINECKTDNRVENLEWCDNRYNINFGTRIERVTKSISKANTNNPKLSKKVLCVETGLIYQSTRDIERQFGFNHSHICACCNGKHKSAYKFQWKWED